MWEKWLANIAHAVIIGSLSWIAAHPGQGWEWLVPALAWCGQCLSPPDIGTPEPPRG